MAMETENAEVEMADRGYRHIYQLWSCKLLNQDQVSTSRYHLAPLGLLYTRFGLTSLVNSPKHLSSPNIYLLQAEWLLLSWIQKQLNTSKPWLRKVPTYARPAPQP